MPPVKWVQLESGGTDAEKLELARKVLRHHSDCLAAWLTDNTEDTFEEEPEVDNARFDMEEALRLIGEPS
jgi:hypothetical protein